MTGSQVVGFSYAGLDAALAADAQALAGRFHGLRRRTNAEGFALGRDFLAIKDRLGHGYFGPWIKAEFGDDGVRTIQRMMSMADVLGDESDKLSFLPATTVQALAAKSTPDAVRTDVLQRIDAGKPVDTGTVLALVKMGRAEAHRDNKMRQARLSSRERRKRAADPKYAARQKRREEREGREIEESQRLRREAAVAAAELIIGHVPADVMPELLAQWEAAERFSYLRDRILQWLPPASGQRSADPVPAEGSAA